MRLAEQRISRLAHAIYNRLWRDDLVDCPDEGRALTAIKTSLTRIFSVEDEVDSLVRDKLQRQKKIPGSHDWQLLYERYFSEELTRRGWR